MEEKWLHHISDDKMSYVEINDNELITFTFNPSKPIVYPNRVSRFKLIQSSE